MKKINNFLKKAVLTASVAGISLFSNKLLAQEPKLPSDLVKIQNIIPEGLNTKEKYIRDTTNFINKDNNMAGSLIFDAEIVKNGTKQSLKINSIKYTQDYKFINKFPDSNIVSLYGSKDEPNALKMRITSVNKDYKTVELEAIDPLSKIHKVVFRNGWELEIWNNNSIKNHDFKDWIGLVSDIRTELINGKVCYLFTLALQYEPQEKILISLLDSTEKGRLQFPIANVCFTAPIREPNWRMKLTAKQNYKIKLATTIGSSPSYVYDDTVLVNALVGKLEKLNVDGEVLTAADPDYEHPTWQKEPFDTLRKIYGKNVAHPSEFIFGMSEDNKNILIAYKSKPEDGLAKDTAFHRSEIYQSMFAYSYTKQDSFELNSPFIMDSINIAIKTSRILETYYLEKPKIVYGTTSLNHNFKASSKDTLMLNLISMPNMHFDSWQENDTAMYKTKIERVQYDFAFVKDSLNKYVIKNKEFGYKKYTQSIYQYNSLFRTELQTDFTTRTSDAEETDSVRISVLNDTTLRIMYRDMIRPILASKMYEMAAPFNKMYLFEPKNDTLFIKPDSLKFSWSSAPKEFRYRFSLSQYEDMYNPIIDSLLQDTSMILMPPKQASGTSARYYWKVAAENIDGKVETETRQFIIKDTIATGITDYPHLAKELLYPNPAENSTTLKIYLEKQQNISLKIYDMLGNEKNIFEGNLPQGEHNIPIDLDNLPSGIYLVKEENTGITQKIVKR